MPIKAISISEPEERVESKIAETILDFLGRIPITSQTIAKKVGIRITQRVIGKGVSRWLPIVGALGVAGYAYYDTGQVAHTAIDLFQQVIEFEPE
jgi:hypothetical protein